jgi:predicted DNA-binding transcriptional regulator AlpA
MSPAIAESPALPQLLDTEDICKLFGIHRDTARLWARTGRLPRPIKVGVRWKWRRDAIESNATTDDDSLRVKTPSDRLNSVEGHRSSGLSSGVRHRV